MNSLFSSSTSSVSTSSASSTPAQALPLEESDTPLKKQHYQMTPPSLVQTNEPTGPICSLQESFALLNLASVMLHPVATIKKIYNSIFPKEPKIHREYLKIMPGDLLHQITTFLPSADLEQFMLADPSSYKEIRTISAYKNFVVKNALRDPRYQKQLLQLLLTACDNNQEISSKAHELLVCAAPYIAELNLSGIESTSFAVNATTFDALFSHCTCLNLSHAKINDAILLAIVTNAPHLSRLSINNTTTITADGVKAILNEKLTFLDISGNAQLADETLFQCIATQCPNLKGIKANDLVFRGAADALFIKLTTLKNFEELHCGFNKFSDLSDLLAAFKPGTLKTLQIDHIDRYFPLLSQTQPNLHTIINGFNPYANHYEMLFEAILNGAPFLNQYEGLLVSHATAGTLSSQGITLLTSRVAQSQLSAQQLTSFKNLHTVVGNYSQRMFFSRSACPQPSITTIQCTFWEISKKIVKQLAANFPNTTYLHLKGPGERAVAPFIDDSVMRRYCDERAKGLSEIYRFKQLQTLELDFGNSFNDLVHMSPHPNLHHIRAMDNHVNHYNDEHIVEMIAHDCRAMIPQLSTNFPNLRQISLAVKLSYYNKSDKRLTAILKDLTRLEKTLRGTSQIEWSLVQA